MATFSTRHLKIMGECWQQQAEIFDVGPQKKNLN
jgi:hypothetical protein